MREGPKGRADLRSKETSEGEEEEETETAELKGKLSTLIGSLNRSSGAFPCSSRSFTEAFIALK